jgi:RNA polymerase sigma factor (sigma-70 family)
VDELRTLEWDALIAQIRSAGRTREHRVFSPRQQALWDELSRRVQVLTDQSGLQSALSGEDRQDVAQTALYKLVMLNDAGQLDHVESAENYLRRLVRNTAIDLVRQRQLRWRHVSPWDDHLDAPDVSTDDILASPELLRSLKIELDRLSVTDRELIHLRFFREMTFADIARLKGLNYSAVAVRMFRLLGRLRARIEQHTARIRPNK